MRAIRKKIVVDESNRPIAVQIAYEDWLEIEHLLKPSIRGAEPMHEYAGTIHLGEDPLQYKLEYAASGLDWIIDTNVAL